MKHCGRCKTYKPLDEFHRSASSKDGRASECKICACKRVKEWNEKNRDKANEKSRNWQRDNRLHRKRYMRDYYAANRDKLISANVRWNRDHPDVVKRVAAEYRKRVKEDRDTVIRQCVRSAKARATKHGRKCEITVGVLDAWIKTQNERCIITGFEFDYATDENYRSRPLIPSIDRIDSNGDYTLDNIQIVCTLVNRAKNEFSQDLFDAMCHARVAIIDGVH